MRKDVIKNLVVPIAIGVAVRLLTPQTPVLVACPAPVIVVVPPPAPTTACGTEDGTGIPASGDWRAFLPDDRLVSD